MTQITSNVEQILNRLPEDEREEFLRFVDAKASLVDVQKCLKDLVEIYKIDIPTPATISIHRWRQKRFKLAQQISNFNLLNSEYEGVKVKEIVERMVFQLSELVFKLVDRLNANSDGISDSQFLKQLPALVRELRQLSELIDNFDKFKSDKDLIMSGAYELYHLLKPCFADTQFEQSFETAVWASIKQMQVNHKLAE